MRLRRGYLFSGLFLVALGAVPLLRRAGLIEVDRLADAWRLWPVLLIAIGLAIVLGRYRAGLIVTVVVALVAGGLVGTAIAAGGRWIPGFADCASTGDLDLHVERDGTFTRPTALRVEIDCGTIDIGTQTGSAWTVTADHRGPAPAIEVAETSLDLRPADDRRSYRIDWTVRAGTQGLDEIDVAMNAGSGAIVVPGAALRHLSARVNAGDLRIDGTDARIEALTIQSNAARVRVTLDGATRGSIEVNASAIEVCVPPDADLVFEIEENITLSHSLAGDGFTKSGTTLTRAGDGPDIAFDVRGNAASLTLDPDGGCT
jgi:hypothetical protein